MADRVEVHAGPLGTCCTELRDAVTTPPVSFFRVEPNGVLYLTVGYAQTAEGIGWFDQAVLFCPFCGSRLQDKEAILRRAQKGGS